MRIRWLSFGTGATLGAMTAFWLLRPRPALPAWPVQVPAPQTLLGDWFELAIRPRQPEDRIGTRYRLEATGTGLRLSCSYHVQQFDTPARQASWPVTLEAGRLQVGNRPLRLLAAEADYLLVASPDARSLWLLGRTPELALERWQALEQRLQQAGLLPPYLVRTPHV